MPSPSLNPVDIHDYRWQIPTEFITAYDRIHSKNDIKYGYVHTDRWAFRKLITDAAWTAALPPPFNTPIVLNADGVDQWVKYQEAVRVSALNQWPIDWPDGFIQLGIEASRIDEFVLPPDPFTIVPNPNPLILTSEVTVSHTSHGAYVGENVFFGDPHVQKPPAIEVMGVDLTIRRAHVITHVSTNEYKFTINRRATGTGTGGGSGVLATYRAPWRAVHAYAGAMIVMGDDAKLWRKSGNNAGQEAGAGSLMYNTQPSIALNSNGFYIEGGQIGFMDDDLTHKGGHCFGILGTDVTIRSRASDAQMLLNGIHGIQVVQGGGDHFIYRIKSRNIDPEGGGGVRLANSPAGMLVEECDILSSDDAMMNSGSGATNQLWVMYVNNHAVAQQGAQCVSIISNKGVPPLADRAVTEDGNIVWNRRFTSLFAGCSGRSGNVGFLDGGTQGGPQIKLTNANAVENVMYCVGTPWERSRDITGRGGMIKPERGPVKLYMIDSPVVAPLREALYTEPTFDEETGELVHSSTSEIVFVNSPIQAPRTPGVPTIKLLGAKRLKFVNSSIATSGGDGLDMGSDLGTFGELILSGSRITEIATDHSGVVARHLTEARVRGTHFSAKAGATDVTAVRRLSGSTNVVAGTARRNTYTGLTELVTGHPFNNDETDFLLRRFVETPSADVGRLYDDTFTMLKASAAYPLLDFFYMLCAESAQAARQNWIKDEFNCIEVGDLDEDVEDDEEPIFTGPEFVRGRGYRGSLNELGVSTRYLINSFIPADELSALFQKNSASLGIWSGENLSAGSDIVDFELPSSGTDAGAELTIRRVSGLTRIRLNNDDEATTPGSVGAETGFWILRRAGPTIVNLRHDLADVASLPLQSNGVASRGFRLARAPRLCMGAFGGAYIGDAACNQLREVMQFFITGMTALIPTP